MRKAEGRVLTVTLECPCGHSRIKFNADNMDMSRCVCRNCGRDIRYDIMSGNYEITGSSDTAARERGQAGKPGAITVGGVYA